MDGLATLTTSPSFIPSSVLEIRSSLSLLPSQTIPLPFIPSPSATSTFQPNYAARLLTSSPPAKSPLFLITTPTDRATATTEGSSIWSVSMRPWGEQVDELVEAGSYSDALALLNSIESPLLPDKARILHTPGSVLLRGLQEERIRVVRGLNAVSQFRSAQYTQAINAFLELNINPAKIVALYPDTVSGRLAEPEEEWVHLFGGPAPKRFVKSDSQHSEHGEEIPASTSQESEGSVGETASSDTTQSPPRPPSPGSVRGLIRTSLDTIRSGATPAKKDDETASIKAKRKDCRYPLNHLYIAWL